MKTKLYNFFNSPWVAFPTIVLFFVLFMMVALKADSWHPKKPAFLEYLLNGK